MEIMRVNEHHDCKIVRCRFVSSPPLKITVIEKRAAKVGCMMLNKTLQIRRGYVCTMELEQGAVLVQGEKAGEFNPPKFCQSHINGQMICRSYQQYRHRGPRNGISCLECISFFFFFFKKKRLDIIHTQRLWHSDYMVGQKCELDPFPPVKKIMSTRSVSEIQHTLWSILTL